MAVRRAMLTQTIPLTRVAAADSAVHVLPCPSMALHNERLTHWVTIYRRFLRLGFILGNKPRGIHIGRKVKVCTNVKRLGET